MSNAKCCETVVKESCCNTPAPVNVYINSCRCCRGSDSDSSDNVPAQSIMRCSGIFDEQQAANTVKGYTPIVQDGDSSLVVGSKFVAPVSGLYVLQVGANMVYVDFGDYCSAVYKVDINNIRTNIATNQVYNSNYVPSATAIAWLNKDEYLYSTMFATKAISLNHLSRPFEFALISSQGADPIAFQALQDEAASPKETDQE